MKSHGPPSEVVGCAVSRPRAEEPSKHLGFKYCRRWAYADLRGLRGLGFGLLGVDRVRV